MTTQEEDAFDLCRWLQTQNSRDLFLLAKHLMIGKFTLDKAKKLLEKLKK